jgi:hypothetical protein
MCFPRIWATALIGVFFEWWFSYASTRNFIYVSEFSLLKWLASVFTPLLLICEIQTDVWAGGHCELYRVFSWTRNPQYCIATDHAARSAVLSPTSPARRLAGTTSDGSRSPVLSSALKTLLHTSDSAYNFTYIYMLLIIILHVNQTVQFPKFWRRMYKMV